MAPSTQSSLALVRPVHCPCTVPHHRQKNRRFRKIDLPVLGGFLRRHPRCTPGRVANEERELLDNADPEAVKQAFIDVFHHRYRGVSVKGRAVWVRRP